MVRSRFSVFDLVNMILSLLALAVFTLPFLYVLFMSISDTFLIANGTFKFFPAGFQLDSYAAILSSKNVWTGFLNSFIYSTVGTILTLVLCSLPAYVLTTKEFKFKRSFTVFFALTMFFDGGIIPAFLVMRGLGLIDTLWAIVIPPALSAWNIILFRTNFKEVPTSLIESAKMDGAGQFWIYAKVVVPLSKPVFAVLSIFSYVAIWNSYFSALLYLTSPSKQPLMIVMRKLLISENIRGNVETFINKMGKVIDIRGFTQSTKMAMIIVSIAPVIMIYPFMQRHLASGFLVGAIKE